MRTQIKIAIVVFTLLVFGPAAFVEAKEPPRDVFGVRIGMHEEEVHERLRKIAVRQEEDRENEKESEQEVWLLRRDDRYEYLLTRFNRNKRLMLVTLVARPNRVRYSDIASAKEATVVTDGRNFSYKWKTEKRGDRPATLLIARGSSQEYITSYSLYPAK